MGREINITLPINKIVSLVPSITELLFDLGLEEKVIGRTKFCIHPESKISKVQIVGGTKDFHIERISALQPDLIIGNKEENKKELIQSLESSFPTWISDITTLSDVYDLIENLSDLLNTQEKGLEISDRIKRDFSSIPDFNGTSVLYLIWYKPYMGVGNNTFINTLLKKLGLNNVLEDKERYPQLSKDQLVSLDPDYLFLSSEPFPFSDKHKEKFEKLLPNSRIICVNGEMFSWYGSRLLQASNYFKKLHSVIIE